VPVVNINKGHNEAIISESGSLHGYVELMAEVRQNTDSGLKLEEAIKKAVYDCIDKNILAEFLKNNSSEVINMLTYEYKIEDEIAVVKEEYERRGEQRGEQRGERRGERRGKLTQALETAKILLSMGMSFGDIAKATGLSSEEISVLKQ
jgi:predicted transposase/invertase (TIGR01784 family)